MDWNSMIYSHVTIFNVNFLLQYNSQRENNTDLKYTA